MTHTAVSCVTVYSHQIVSHGTYTYLSRQQLGVVLVQRKHDRGGDGPECHGGTEMG